MCNNKGKEVKFMRRIKHDYKYSVARSFTLSLFLNQCKIRSWKILVQNIYKCIVDLTLKDMLAL